MPSPGEACVFVTISEAGGAMLTRALSSAVLFAGLVLIGCSDAVSPAGIEQTITSPSAIVPPASPHESDIPPEYDFTPVISSAKSRVEIFYNNSARAWSQMQHSGNLGYIRGTATVSKDNNAVGTPRTAEVEEEFWHPWNNTLDGPMFSFILGGSCGHQILGQANFKASVFVPFTSPRRITSSTTRYEEAIDAQPRCREPDCDGQVIGSPDYDPFDPNGPDCRGDGGGSGGGSGGGDSDCRTEYVVIEISTDGGSTWDVLWQGYTTVCD